ncbi:hypothetical protein MTBPR1_60120 [Candidatus Terasakiella magnetica]|uniref:N-acetyltransferase domain-containing protein n=1 Tax=Candidatus Terasakiella magnetica TaxID=1867952 RepID=A0A1C3RK52_9PROT|nr:GNAT family N-acetyltransferase [Candidatus Terasakiella magnetica]SCA57607.1 hypothetical protein MTBPR1_60120 [Candidatus Terasakiella magnetica]
MKKWNVQTNTRFLKAKNITELYNNVWSADGFEYDISFETFDKMFSQGCYGFFVFEEQKLIGMARVFSDDVMTSWVAEVIVHPSWQKKGVGSALTDAVKRRFSHTSIYLESLLHNEEFFVKNGIKPQSKLVSCSRPSAKVLKMRQAC